MPPKINVRQHYQKKAMIARLRERGTARERDIAFRLFKPSGDAAGRNGDDGAEMLCAREAKHPGAGQAVSLGKGLNTMSTDILLGSEIAKIYQNSLSLPSICQPEACKWSPEMRVRNGYPPLGDCPQCTVTALLDKIGKEVTLPGQNGEPAYVTHGLGGDIEVETAHGEIFNPEWLWLPGAFHDRWLHNLRTHLERCEPGEKLTFQAVFLTYPRPNAVPPNAGYSWRMRWLGAEPPQRIDPLAELRIHTKKMLAAQQALLIQGGNGGDHHQPLTIDNAAE